MNKATRYLIGLPVAAVAAFGVHQYRGQGNHATVLDHHLKAVGQLNTNGEVVNRQGFKVGSVGKDGEVYNWLGQEIAKATSKGDVFEPSGKEPVLRLEGHDFTVFAPTGKQVSWGRVLNHFENWKPSDQQRAGAAYLLGN